MQGIKNQHQQVLWYLINWDSFSLMDLIKDSMFIKFQTRLSEIESEHGSLTTKTRVNFINRFGNTSSYLVYQCSNKEKSKLLIDKY